MLREVRPEEFEIGDLERFHEECVDQMSGDPNLTDEEKRELLRQLQLPDDEWESIELMITACYPLVGAVPATNAAPGRPLL